MEIENLLSDIQEVHRINLTTLGQEFQTLNIDIQNELVDLSKVNPILEEKYQEDIAIKLFKSSSEVIRDSIDEVTKSYYFNYPREIKENFIKEVLTQVLEWKNKIQERSKNQEKSSERFFFLNLGIL